MGMKLYVGNLPYSVTDSDLQQMFEAYGAVQSALVMPAGSREAWRPTTASTAPWSR